MRALQRTGWRPASIAPGVIAALVMTAGFASAQTPGQPVTFARDVEPIFQEKCQTCHRQGQMGPMPLVTYQDVRPWVRSIRQKVSKRMMPPWHLDPTIGIQEFKNDISLSAEQIDTIVRWIDEGAPLGDPKQAPPPKQWPDGDVWRLADVYGRGPDLIVKSKPWTQPAVGQDQWWQPVVETGLTEDRWVKGIELRPSTAGRRIVHHVVSYLEQQEDSSPGPTEVTGTGDYFSEYAVGKIGDVFRENTGKLMKAGSKIRFDIHYHSVGEALTDSSEIGLWFYPKGETPKYRVYPRAMGVGQARLLDIPPGKVSQHFAYVPLPAPARLENFQPHMHVRGKAMSIEAIYPDGRVEMLNHVDRFDFNWHVNYVYADEAAPVLPRGTIIKVTGWHDNTAANPANPDPAQWVGWGQRSYDEMFHAHVNVVYLTDEDYEQIVQERKRAAASRSAQQQP